MIAASDRASLHVFPGSTAPTASPRVLVWGRYGKAAGFSCSTGGFAVNALHVGGGVMVRANWSRIASRNRMRRQGVEDRKDKSLVASQSPKQPRRKMSKAELREQAEAAFRAWRAGQTSNDK